MASLLRFALGMLVASIAAGPALAADQDWQNVGQALGKEGSIQL